MHYFFNWIGGSRPIGDRLVSMNPTLSRIVLYQKTLELMKEKTGQDPTFVRLGVTKEHPKAFWIRPCGARDEGALKVHTMGKTRMISAKLLFNFLTEKGWYVPKGKTDQFPVDWDDENKAVKVDLTPMSESEA